jgi:hypothetical protein
MAPRRRRMPRPSRAADAPGRSLPGGPNAARQRLAPCSPRQLLPRALQIPFRMPPPQARDRQILRRLAHLQGCAQPPLRPQTPQRLLLCPLSLRCRVPLRHGFNIARVNRGISARARAPGGLSRGLRRWLGAPRRREQSSRKPAELRRAARPRSAGRRGRQRAMSGAPPRAKQSRPGARAHLPAPGRCQLSGFRRSPLGIDPQELIVSP